MNVEDDKQHTNVASLHFSAPHEELDMGDVNQLKYLKHFCPKIEGPILEIGSKDYGNTSSFRDHYRENLYIGIDQEAGTGVDMVIDLTLGIGTLRENHFALGVCCSVLEHVRKPWIMAHNISRLIKPNGLLYVSVPWVWRYHAYPDDYFRFSWRGIMALFEEFAWENILYSTNVPGEFVEINLLNPGIDNQMAIFLETGSQARKYLPYLLVNMIGKKMV